LYNRFLIWVLDRFWLDFWACFCHFWVNLSAGFKSKMRKKKIPNTNLKHNNNTFINRFLNDHGYIRALPTDSIYWFTFLNIGKISQKPPHNRYPKFSFSFWEATVLPNTLDSTVASQLNFLLKKINVFDAISLCLIRLIWSLSLSLPLLLVLLWRRWLRRRLSR